MCLKIVRLLLLGFEGMGSSIHKEREKDILPVINQVNNRMSPFHRQRFEPGVYSYHLAGSMGCFEQ